MNLGQIAEEKYYDGIDIAQLAVSILVFFLSLLFMGLVVVAGFGQVTTDYDATFLAEPGMVINLVLTGLVSLVIASVSTVTTIQKITGHAKDIKPADDKELIFFIVGLLLVFGLAALAGLASDQVRSSALAVLAVPGIAIPVFWLLHMGRRGRRTANPKRDSGILTFSIGISIPFIVLVELLAVILLLIVMVAGLFNQPQFRDLFTNLLNNPSLLQNDPTRLFSEFEGMFDLPNLTGWLLLAVAGITPLLEELFKTLGVWLLKVRNPSPAESFWVGLLCGGAFALFEGLLSMGSSLQLGETGYLEWAGLIIGRFGGSLLHILTGGIIGLAIGKFWQHHKLGSLLLAYITAWLLHASWNTLTIFGGVNPLVNENQGQAVWPYIALVLLFLGMLFWFLGLVNKVQKLINLPTIADGSEG